MILRNFLRMIARQVFVWITVMCISGVVEIFDKVLDVSRYKLQLDCELC